MPPTAPLRTVRESFQLTRLKPSKRLLRDAAVETAESAVQLTMTLRVQKLAVGCAVVPAEDLWDDVVAVPARLPRDRETACRALSALRPPQVQQDGATRKGVGHVPAFAFLKVHLPRRMVWVRGAFYLGVQMETAGTSRGTTTQRPCSIRLPPGAEEAPRPATTACEVPPHEPSFALSWMPPQGPAPECFEDGVNRRC